MAIALTFVRKRPLQSCAATAFALLLAGVVANATAFQKGRHPAPLFSAPQHEQARAYPPPPAASAPAPRPAERPAPTVAEDPRVVADPVPAHASVARHEDGIGRLIRSGAPEGVQAPQAKPAAPAGPSRPSATAVLTAQRALAKLGYGVKPDGMMGEATRQAVETFARGHHLPPGEGISPKLLRELTAAAPSSPG